MSEDLGSAVLRLDANPSPLTGALATAKAKTIASMRGTSAASAAAFAAGMVAVGAAVGVGLYKIGKEYETAYQTIRTETGATGERMEKLKSSFKNVFGSTPADAEDVATALAEVHKRTGQTGKPLEDLTLQFLRLSSATGTDVKTNVQNVTRAFNDWGIQAKDQGKTLDGFFAVSQKTGIAVSDLAGSLVQFGSPMRALGYDVNEAAAMFGAFERAGVNVSTMMPGLRMGLKNIAKPTDELRARFKELGIDTRDPKQALTGIMETIEGMKNPTDAASFAMDVFGARAGTDMAQAIREGRFEVDDLVKTMKSSKGSIEENASANATLEGRMKILQHRVTNLIEPIATKFVGALVDLAGILLDLTDKFNALPGPVKQVIGYAALLAGGIVALTLAINKAKLAFTGIQTAMAANPYVLIIAATVAIAYLIFKNWDKIKEFLSKTWGTIKSVASKAWQGIRDFFKKNWQWILAIFIGPLGILGKLIYNNWDKIKQVTGAAWSWIRDLIKKRFQASLDAVRMIGNAIGGFFSAVWDRIKKNTSAAWGFVRDRIIEPVRKARQSVIDTIGGMASWIGRTWTKIVDGARELGTNIKDALVSAFTGLYDWIKQKLEDITNLPGFKQIKDFGGWVGSNLSSTVTSAALPSAPGLPSFGTAGASASGASAAPTVNITFADGMGWLREFVNVEIEGHGHEVGQVWIAGAGGIG